MAGKAISILAAIIGSIALIVALMGSGGGSAGIQGLTGPTGALGPSGSPGATGPIGLIGDTGPAGPTGSPGPSGSPGSPGSTGATGPAGSPGPSGAPGPSGSPGTNGTNFNGTYNGVISVTGYVNSAPFIVNSNPWLGTPNTSRALGIGYNNSIGKTIIVYVSISITGNAISGTNGFIFYIVPSGAIALGSFTNTAITQTVTCTFIVNKNMNYQINPTGSVTLLSWTEQIL